MGRGIPQFYDSFYQTDIGEGIIIDNTNLFGEYEDGKYACMEDEQDFESLTVEQEFFMRDIRSRLPKSYSKPHNVWGSGYDGMVISENGFYHLIISDEDTFMMLALVVRKDVLDDTQRRNLALAGLSTAADNIWRKLEPDYGPFRVRDTGYTSRPITFLPTQGEPQHG